jgi:hypothetical protein
MQCSQFTKIVVIIFYFLTCMFKGAQESEDDSPVAQNREDNNVRLSRSSLSENCSSPNDQYEDFRIGDNDADNGEGSMRPSFHQEPNDNSFYSKKSTKSVEMNNAYSMDYSEKSKRIMSNMGYKPGKGLGKHGHGRVEPVEASTQKGRRGLGSKPSVVGEIPQDLKWSPEDLKAEAKEEPVSY